jgi:hypothetical protein
VCEQIVEAVRDLNADGQRHNVEIISQECFYRTLTDAERQTASRGQFNFDHPGILFLLHFQSILLRFMVLAVHCSLNSNDH